MGPTRRSGLALRNKASLLGSRARAHDSIVVDRQMPAITCDLIMADDVYARRDASLFWAGIMT